MHRERSNINGVTRKNTAIAEGIYEMTIETDVCAEFMPGQFINIYLDDKSMLLPRPISICDAEKESVTIIYRVAGKGTEYLSSYSAGRIIKIGAPLGNGYALEQDYEGKSAALVAGGVGIPPMVGLAKKLKQKHATVCAFLGFQSEPFLTERLKEYGARVSVSTDDGSLGFHGNAVDMLKSSGKLYDAYFSCGPKAMMKALSAYTATIDRNVQVSLEERMGCGYGACVGCACVIREKGVMVKKKVCKHGPVFWGKDVVWNE